MGKLYDNKITTTSGFKFDAYGPLDDRDVVQSKSDLGDLYLYEGMKVYVAEEKKTYQLINDGSDDPWKPIATEEYVNEILNNKDEVIGNVAGNPVVINDVSPLEHEIKVKLANSGTVPGKNLFRFTEDFIDSGEYTSDEYDVEAETGGEGWSYEARKDTSKFVIQDAHGDYLDNKYHSNVYFDLSTLLSTLDQDKQYTLSFTNIDNGDWVGMWWTFGTVYGDLYNGEVQYTFTPRSLTNTDKTLALSTYGSVTIGIQIEEGTTATEYEDYGFIDFSTITLKKYGLNVFDSESRFPQLGFKKQEDGSWLANNYHGKVVTPPTGSSQMFFRATAKSTKAHTSTPFYIRVYYTDGTYSTPFTLENNQTDWKELQGCSDASKTISAINFSYGGNVATEKSYYIKDVIFSYVDAPYEPYVEPTTYTDISTDGMVSGVTSLYPTTMLLANTEAVAVEAKYIKNINKAIGLEPSNDPDSSLVIGANLKNITNKVDTLREETANALVCTEKNIGIKLDVSPLNTGNIEVSSYYCFKPVEFIHDSEDNIAYSFGYDSDLEFNKPYPIVYIGERLVDPDFDDWYEWEYSLFDSVDHRRTLTICPEGPGMVNPFNLKSGDVIMFVKQDETFSSEVGYLTSVYRCEPDLNHSENNNHVPNASIVKYGKNIYENDLFLDTTDTQSGVTITKYANGTVKLSGTAAADIEYSMAYVVGSPNALPSGTCVTLSGGISENCYLEIQEGEWSEMSCDRPDNIYYDYGNGVTFFIPYDNGVYRVYLHIKKGTNFDNITIYPQIEVGKVKTSWEAPRAPKTYTANEEGKAIIPVEDYETITLLSNWDACLHATYNRDINEAFEEQTAAIGSINKALDNIMATEEYVDKKVAELVDSAPSTLNTLNELAQALGDDPNFATTIAGQIGDKAGKAELQNLSDTVSNKADKTEVQNLARTVSNKADKTEVQNLTNTVNSKADLIDGKVPVEQLPEKEPVEITGVTTGNPVVINDTSPLEHEIKVKLSEGVDVNGATVQKYGKNLFNPSEYAKAGSLVNTTLDEDIFIASQNEIKAGIFVNNARKVMTKAGTYTITVYTLDQDEKRSLTIAIYTKSNIENAIVLVRNGIVESDKPLSVTFTETEDFALCLIGPSIDYRKETARFKIMLQAGESEDKTYEPYKNPDPLTADENGNISIIGNGEIMTLIAEDEFDITVEYVKNINKAIGLEPSNDTNSSLVVGAHLTNIKEDIENLYTEADTFRVEVSEAFNDVAEFASDTLNDIEALKANNEDISKIKTNIQEINNTLENKSDLIYFKTSSEYKKEFFKEISDSNFYYTESEDETADEAFTEKISEGRDFNLIIDSNNKEYTYLSRNNGGDIDTCIYGFYDEDENPVECFEIIEDLNEYNFHLNCLDLTYVTYPIRLYKTTETEETVVPFSGEVSLENLSYEKTNDGIKLIAENNIEIINEVTPYSSNPVTSNAIASAINRVKDYSSIPQIKTGNTVVVENANTIEVYPIGKNAMPYFTDYPKYSDTTTTNCVLETGALKLALTSKLNKTIYENRKMVLPAGQYCFKDSLLGHTAQKYGVSTTVTLSRRLDRNLDDPIGSNTCVVVARFTNVDDTPVMIEAPDGIDYITYQVKSTVKPATNVNPHIILYPQLQATEAIEQDYPIVNLTTTNLFPYPWFQSSRTSAGLTYTDNKDGTLLVNGTYNSNKNEYSRFTFMNGYEVNYKAGYYSIRMLEEEVDGVDFEITVREVDGYPETDYVTGEKFKNTFTFYAPRSIGSMFIWMHCKEDTKINNMLVKPQLVYSETIPDWEDFIPYGQRGLITRYSKNLLRWNGSAAGSNGITITALPGGTYQLNGTATQDTIITFSETNEYFRPQGALLLSGGKFIGSSTCYFELDVILEDGSIVTKTLNDKPIEITEKIIGYSEQRLVVPANHTFNSIVFAPMLEVNDTGIPSEFVRYEMPLTAGDLPIILEASDSVNDWTLIAEPEMSMVAKYYIKPQEIVERNNTSVSNAVLKTVEGTNYFTFNNDIAPNEHLITISSTKPVEIQISGANLINEDDWFNTEKLCTPGTPHHDTLGLVVPGGVSWSLRKGTGPDTAHDGNYRGFYGHVNWLTNTTHEYGYYKIPSYLMNKEITISAGLKDSSYGTFGAPPAIAVHTKKGSKPEDCVVKACSSYTFTEKDKYHYTPITTTLGKNDYLCFSTPGYNNDNKSAINNSSGYRFNFYRYTLYATSNNEIYFTEGATPDTNDPLKMPPKYKGKVFSIGSQPIQIYASELREIDELLHVCSSDPDAVLTITYNQDINAALAEKSSNANESNIIISETMPEDGTVEDKVWIKPVETGYGAGNYVVASGFEDGWIYREWNDGYLELTIGDISIDKMNQRVLTYPNGYNNLSVAYPFVSCSYNSYRVTKNENSINILNTAASTDTFSICVKGHKN